MVQLDKMDGAWEAAGSLFSALVVYNLSVAAVLAGAAPGQVWADDPDEPRVALVRSPEGYYLAGDAQHTALEDMSFRDLLARIDAEQERQEGEAEDEPAES